MCGMMENDVRSLITNLDGYKAVAVRLGKRPTTVHTHMQAGVLPAAWYCALCDLSVEIGQTPPPRSLFSFVSLLPSSEEVA
jgi:hypothetical protein